MRQVCPLALQYSHASLPSRCSLCRTIRSGPDAVQVPSAVGPNVGRVGSFSFQSAKSPKIQGRQFSEFSLSCEGVMGISNNLPGLDFSPESGLLTNGLFRLSEKIHTKIMCTYITCNVRYISVPLQYISL